MALPLRGPDYLTFEEKGKVGLKNTNGDIIIPAQYEALGWSEGKFSVTSNVLGYRLNGLWGLLTLSNTRVTKPEYSSIVPRSSLFIATRTDQRTLHQTKGILDATGKVIIPFQYQGLEINGLRVITVQKVGSHYRYGLTDLDHKTILPLKFTNIYPLGSLRYAVVNDNGKSAIFSDSGSPITDFRIDSISAYRDNAAIVYDNNLKGVIDRDGNFIADPVYRDVEIKSGEIRIRKPDQWLFVTARHEVLKQVAADSVTAISNKYYKRKLNEKYQVFDQELKPLNGTDAEYLKPFGQDKAIFRRDGRFGIMQLSGKIIRDPQFSECYFDNSVLRVKAAPAHTGRWSLLDSNGVALTVKQYDHVGLYNGTFFPVRNRNFRGAIDLQGREIIACVHDSIVSVKAGLVVVKFRGGYGIMNLREQWLVTPQQYPITIISTTRYLLHTPSVHYLKSIRGEIIYFTSNVITVKDDHIVEQTSEGRTVIVNLNGVVVNQSAVIPATAFDEIFAESEGLRAIKKDGRFGFVDKRYRLRIANRYEGVKAFREGLAPVKILGRWGYINKEDNIAIQPVYDEVWAFENGVAKVRKQNLFGLIDKAGKVVIPIRYNEIVKIDDNRFRVQQNLNYGIIDKNGTIVVNTKFTQLKETGDGFRIVGQNGKFGVINAEGVTTIPIIYNSVVYDPYHKHFVVSLESAWEQIFRK